MDMLAVEAQLYGDPQESEPEDGRQYSLDVAAQDDTPSVGHMDDEGASALDHAGHGAGAAAFQASKKSGTLKKYYKKIFKATSTKSIGQQDVGGSSHHSAHTGGGPYGASPQPLYSPSSSAAVGPTTSKASNISSQADDEDDGVTSQLGRGSRMSTRYDMGRADAMSEAGGGVGSSMDRNANMGSLKNMFGSKKKKISKQIELDAIRLEMEMLQERYYEAENSLAATMHEAGALAAERQQLQESGRELVMELEEAQTALAKAQADLEHTRTLNTQVKGALQGAYSDNQALTKQLKDAEELCTAQQNSLEEAEERCRRLTESHDRLHHAGLQLKAQLVTATAAAAEARAAREELLQQLSVAEASAAALQAEVESRDVKMAEMERQQAESSAQMESMLGRLRELEGDTQQLEARSSMLRDENVELGARVDQLLKRQAEVEEERNELRIQLQAQQHSSLEQQSNWAEQLSAMLLNREQAETQVSTLAADLRRSVEGGELLKQRNDELADELGRLREAQQKKPGSPLKWRRTGNSNGGGASQPQQQHHQRTPSLAGSEGGSGGGNGSAVDYRPMTANAALQTGAGAVGRTLTEDAVHATVSVAVQQSPGDATSYGPLAAGRAAHKQGTGFDGASKAGAGAAYEARDTYSSRDGRKGSSGNGGGFVGKLFGCFAPPVVAEGVH